jgi:hypothetical protein
MSMLEVDREVARWWLLQKEVSGEAVALLMQMIMLFCLIWAEPESWPGMELVEERGENTVEC